MSMRRRPLIAGALAVLAASSGLAQTPGKVWRIGVLSQSFERLSGVFAMLTALGYEEGRNFVVDHKFAQGRLERLPALAAELVATKPDLLLGASNADVQALKNVTSTIPILMMYAWGPVETGLVSSLARPGGNVTGTTTNSFEMAGKMTQVLRDSVPSMSRLIWLYEPDYPGMSQARVFANRAAAAMGINLSYLLVRSAADMDSALAALRRDRPDAIGVAMTGPLVQHSNRVIELAAQLKLPALYSIDVPVRAGGLMSYGPDFVEVNRRLAWMIDRILKGTKPADIPVEEPAKFLLVINLKTARAMGLVIPQSVLLQATELIE